VKSKGTSKGKGKEKKENIYKDDISIHIYEINFGGQS
jgi:hypothetical protein